MAYDPVIDGFGYEPDLEQPDSGEPPSLSTDGLPASSMLDSSFLPPVGQQQTPSCFVWASGYGCATYAAARKAGSPPSSDTTLSVSPTYVQILQGTGVKDRCQGGTVASVFEYLKANGAQSLATAAKQYECFACWEMYGDAGRGDNKAMFRTDRWSTVEFVPDGNPDQPGVLAIKAAIHNDMPVAYGTWLDTDYQSYEGEPPVFVGTGEKWMGSNGKPVGHVMMIVGYDDERPYGKNPKHGPGSGAFLIQNSHGTAWGARGFMWMAYPDFVDMAQGKAFYITQIG